MRYLLSLSCIVLLSCVSLGQYNNNHSEIGVEIQAASFSTHGGTVGGALKYAYVLDDAIAFGPSFRYQYNWSKNTYLGTEGSSYTIGGGGFFHYRFLEWFFLGTEIEVLRNPFRYYHPEKKWKLTAFVGGGIAKDFGPVVLNVGILYDIVDAVRDPYTTNQSPLSRGYFLKVSNPEKPNYGKYIPLIYRIAFFFPLNRD